MANQEQLEILKQDRVAWNRWREKNQNIQPDLHGADLSGANLTGVDLSGVNLKWADLSSTNLKGANLKGANLRWVNLRESRLWKVDLRWANLAESHLGKADLRGAELREAYLWKADLSGAILRGVHLWNAFLEEANLCEANLSGANFSAVNLYKAHLNRASLVKTHLWMANLRNADLRGANLHDADLRGANLVDADLGRANLCGANLKWANLSGANLREANLTGCSIHGISAWNVHLMDTIQSNLIITRGEKPIITVDNLEVAQFIYLLLNNQKIRDVIDTVTAKVVLILGRFTPERKAVLEAIKDELRKQKYVPVMFDFAGPTSRDVTETITTLARMSRFIIADLTDPKSIPQELALIVPNLPSVPVQPLIESSQREYGMFSFFTRFPWVLPIYHYTDQGILLQSLKENVIDPAEHKAKELAKR